jgi:hypothetical protein
MKPARPLHLEIQTHRPSPVGLIRSSYRQDGKVKHSTHGRITGLSLDQLRLIRAAFNQEVIPRDAPQAFQITQSKEYGASAAALALAKELGLERMIYSRSEPWVKDVLAMVVGRLTYAGSKLSLSHLWPQTALWELCGVDGAVDVDRHCYEPMDRLLERQAAIQRTLAQRHLSSGPAVLYDITSTYFEGQYAQSQLVCFGYSRDGKRGHEQITLGLVCTPSGCPVAVEVFAGNTLDAKTVPEKIRQLQEDYGIKELIFVGDRGMITRASYDQIKGREGLATITTLTHLDLVQLLERKVITPELFDERQIVEVIDPDQPQMRYCLCRNPETGAREKATRQALLEATTTGLAAIAGAKRRAKPDRLGARVGKLLAKYKMGKFVRWAVQEGRLQWHLDQAAIDAEARLDGCYIVRADFPAEQMAAVQVVAAYRDLARVEQGFRQLKTVQLEVRPVYHQLDRRIRCHVFLCMLAYYLQWHMNQRLQPLFEQDGEGKDRRWIFPHVLECLKAIRRQTVQVGQVSFSQITVPNPDQQKILNLLKVKV